MESYRVVPMRLFATWEVDRTSPNCVPRVCVMTLNRLTVMKPLDSDINCLVIAIKLQGYKRTLRSNELVVSAVNGIIDIDLDISFTLQYPHFVKRKGNCLQILLQKKKKYKNRPLPGGFKTLASGVINLTDILQSSFDRELCLYPDDGGKDDSALGYGSATGSSSGFGSGWVMGVPTGPPLAKLYLMTCSSQPLEQEDSRKEKENEIPDFSDDDVDEDSTNEEGGYDSEPILDEPPSSSSAQAAFRRFQQNFHNKLTPSGKIVHHAHHHHSHRSAGARQKNIKAKFMAVLRKFKISEEDAGDGHSEARQPTVQELDMLMEELENLSDSEGELDHLDRLSLNRGDFHPSKPQLPTFFPSKEHLPNLEMSGVEGVSEESKESDDVDATDGLETGEGSPGSPGRRAILAPSHSAMETPPSSTTRDYALTPRTPSINIPLTLKEDKRKKNLLLGKAPQDEAAAHTITPSVPELPPLKHLPISEQLAQRLTPEEAGIIPDNLCIISAIDVHSVALVNSLRERQPRVLVVTTQNDLKLVLSALVNRIQRFCNTNSQKPRVTSITLVGKEQFLSFCLKSYVEVFAQKPNEWQTYIRFLLVSNVPSSINRCLACLDSTLSSSLFCDSVWRDWWNKTDLSPQEILEISSRIQKYQFAAKATLPMPIAEAMLQVQKGKGLPEESSQVFVPFIVDLRTGQQGGLSDPVLEQAQGPTVDSARDSILSSLQNTPTTYSPYSPSVVVTPGGAVSAGSSFNLKEGLVSQGSPPNSPQIQQTQVAPSPNSSCEAGVVQDLQVEYWLTVSQTTAQGASGVLGTDKLRPELSSGGLPVGSGSTASGVGGSGKKDSSNSANKVTLKTAFRSLAVSRFISSAPPYPMSAGGATFGDTSLSLTFVKERKQRQMFSKLGMKKEKKEEKDVEWKTQTVEGISRLISSSKHSTMRVYIDGVEWSRVKFFQTSALWQTHVKQFPVALYLPE